MDLRYPIGRVSLPETVDASHIEEWIRDVSEAPGLLRKAVENLSEDQLNTPYRPEGWTVRQLVHHLADTHANTYLNFRSALIENGPIIRGVNVDASANLPDYTSADIGPSLEMFEGIQTRWATLLRGMSASDFERVLKVPDRDDRKLWTLLCIYAWHAKHHVAHITALCDRMGWK